MCFCVKIVKSLMKIPKTNLNIKGKEGILLVVLFLGLIAPIYYFSIRPANNKNQSVSDAPSVSQRVKEPENTNQEKITEQPVLETGDVSPKPQKQAPLSTSSSLSSQPSSLDKCPGLNKSLGDKYLSELNAIRADKQRQHDGIISGLLSWWNKQRKISQLDQETKSKELQAYKNYISGVKSAGCATSGYSAP